MKPNIPAVLLLATAGGLIFMRISSVNEAASRGWVAPSECRSKPSAPRFVGWPEAGSEGTTDRSNQQSQPDALLASRSQVA